jgi:hypothetical protein
MPSVAATGMYDKNILTVSWKTQDQGVDGRIILILKKQNERLWTGFMRLRIRTSSGPWWTR